MSARWIVSPDSIVISSVPSRFSGRGALVATRVIVPVRSVASVVRSRIDSSWAAAWIARQASAGAPWQRVA
jgi:hypothetical protein